MTLCVCVWWHLSLIIRFENKSMPLKIGFHLSKSSCEFFFSWSDCAHAWNISYSSQSKLDRLQCYSCAQRSSSFSLFLFRHLCLFHSYHTNCNQVKLSFSPHWITNKRMQRGLSMFLSSAFSLVSLSPPCEQAYNGILFESNVYSVARFSVVIRLYNQAE